MNLERRKQLERLGVAALAAVLFHAALVLVLELGRFIQVEEEGEYIGPVYVELSDVTRIPDTARVEGEESEAEETAPEEPERPEERPEARPDEPEEPPDAADPDRAPRTEGGSPVSTARTDEAADEPPPESQPREAPEAYRPAEKAPETADNVYSGSDEGNEFTVEMRGRADRAQPAWRIDVDLPDWVDRKDAELEVTFSFIVDTEGRIIHLHLDRSSGHKDVDEAVRRALAQWKFSNPFGKERITGTFTYRTNTR